MSLKYSQLWRVDGRCRQRVECSPGCSLYLTHLLWSLTGNWLRKRPTTPDARGLLASCLRNLGGTNHEINKRSPYGAIWAPLRRTLNGNHRSCPIDDLPEVPLKSATLQHYRNQLIIAEGVTPTRWQQRVLFPNLSVNPHNRGTPDLKIIRSTCPTCIKRRNAILNQSVIP